MFPIKSLRFSGLLTYPILVDILPNVETLVTRIRCHDNKSRSRKLANTDFFVTDKRSSLRSLHIIHDVPFTPDKGIPVFPLFFSPSVRKNGCRLKDVRFLNGPNIINYEVSRARPDSLVALEEWLKAKAHGNLHDAADARFFAWLGQLRHLGFINSEVPPSTISRLLPFCHNLKSLLWHTLPSWRVSAFIIPDPLSITSSM